MDPLILSPTPFARELHIVRPPGPRTPTRYFTSKPSRVLFAGCGIALLVTTVLPLTALAQSMGVNTVSPEVAPAMGLLEVLRSGGSLGVAAICLWWALRKDTQAQKANDDRLEDAKQANAQLIQVHKDYTQAMEHHTRAVEQLTRVIEQQQQRVLTLPRNQAG